ncbi:MAG: PKD domain-containing protein [Chitinophagales bacterium]
MKTIKTKIKESKFLTYVLFCFLFSHLVLNTNAQELPCANEIFNTNQLKDTAFLSYLKQLNLSSNTNSRLSGNTLVIPIVVHVLHLGEPVGTGSNISDDQIYEAVRGANERWKNIAGDGVDMEVQFCLAQFDPNGNPSNGIDRRDASGIPRYTDIGIGYIEGALAGEIGSDELQTKNLSNWRHDYVYNIWVVHKIAGGWGGYAVFPLFTQYPTDGVVITAGSMRYTSSTLAHEIGHGMGLFHTFQGSSETVCPSNGNCSTQGDQVCDTPPHKKQDCTSSNCNNSPDSFLSFKNIMSYCGGRGIFTEGQKTRVRNMILSSTRNLLLSSYACTGPPCDTTHANFSFVVGNNNSVTFTNSSTNASTYFWNFGDDTTSTTASLTHQYAQAGTYVVRLITQNSCNSDTIEKTVSIPFITSVRNNSSSSTLSIFPNPNNGNFNLKYDINNETVYLEAINALGQVVEQQILTSGSEHAIVFKNKLPKGIYKIQLKKNNAVIAAGSLSIY